MGQGIWGSAQQALPMGMDYAQRMIQLNFQKGIQAQAQANWEAEQAAQKARDEADAASRRLEDIYKSKTIDELDRKNKLLEDMVNTSAQIEDAKERGGATVGKPTGKPQPGKVRQRPVETTGKLTRKMKMLEEENKIRYQGLPTEAEQADIGLTRERTKTEKSQQGLYEAETGRTESQTKLYKEQAEYWKGKADKEVTELEKLGYDPEMVRKARNDYNGYLESAIMYNMMNPDSGTEMLSFEQYLQQILEGAKQGSPLIDLPSAGYEPPDMTGFPTDLFKGE